MTHNKMVMGKGAIIMVLWRTIHPSKHTRKKYTYIVRVHRLENAVINHCVIHKIRQKEAGYIFFTQQYFHNGNAPIKVYTHDWWCWIATEGSRRIFFSVTLEELAETSEVEEMSKEVVELVNLAVLDEDEVMLVMDLVPNNDYNSPASKNVSASTKQGEAFYNVDWGHDGISITTIHVFNSL